MSRDEREATADALRAQQVQTHFSNLPWAIGGAALTALFLAVMERNAVAAPWLTAWLVALALVLGGRAVTGLLYRRAAADPSSHRRVLLACRLGFAAHGIVWGLAGALPLADGDVMHRTIVIIVLACITASSFTMTVSDLVAGLCFAAPALGLLSLSLFLQTESVYWTLGGAAIGALLFMSLTARRAHQIVRSYVALRVAEAAQAGALRASEELLERTGATAGVGGWELELATMALRLTAQAYHIHDADPVAEPTFAGFVRLYGREQQQAIREGLEDVMLHGSAYDRELLLTTLRGRRRWVRLIGRPQFDAAGKVVRINGVVQDITQAKTAELALAEQHHLLDLLVKTTHEGFWFVDAGAVTTDVNPAMCAILGRPRDQILGKSVYEFLDGPNAAIVREEIKRRDTGLASSYEVALSRPDGTLIDCFNNATPIFDTAGRRVGTVGMWTDISERRRAEQRMRATSEELQQKTLALQLTLDSITQGIVSIDAEGSVRVYNRRALELLDLPEAALAAPATYDDVVRFQIESGELAEDGSFVDASGAHRRFEGGRAGSPDVYVRRSRGGALVEVRTRHLPGGGLVRTFADVTAYFDAQQALRDREDELRALLDAFPGVIAVLDSRHAYTYVNDRFAAMMGRSRNDIIGRPAREIVGDRGFERLLEHTARARIDGPVTVENEYAATAHRPRTFLQVTHAVGADDGAGRSNCYAFGIDVSARKAAERDLIAAKDEAERANQAKSQFLSGMSHELRTPMNAILGFGQLLVSDPKNPLPERQRDYVREILRGARHLLTLINEVLDLALVETGKLRISLEPVQLAPLIDECVGLLRPLARNGAIEVAVAAAPAPDCLVFADRTRLKQVVLNLLSNAIKYNRRGGHVRVECAADGATVRIGISDSGQGLGAEQRARLFQAFERLDAAQSPVEGAGLGLALSQRLVHAMHGEIGLDSEVGQGSTFWIRLPQAARPQFEVAFVAPPSVLGELPSADGSRPRKVLYIEDNPVNVLLMEAMLARMENLQLISAPLPLLGLEMASDERPDLILLDIQLPGMDGFEVLRRLRLDEASRAIPVIAVSANAMAGDIAHGLSVGFVQYLTKPLDMRQLLAAVDAALPQPSLSDRRAAPR